MEKVKRLTEQDVLEFRKKKICEVGMKIGHAKQFVGIDLSKNGRFQINPPSDEALLRIFVHFEILKNNALNFSSNSKSTALKLKNIPKRRLNQRYSR